MTANSAAGRPQAGAPALVRGTQREAAGVANELPGALVEAAGNTVDLVWAVHHHVLDLFFPAVARQVNEDVVAEPGSRIDR